MNEKNYIYIVQELHKNRNRWFAFFKSHNEMREYICEQMPTYKDEHELEDETHTEYIVTRIAEDKNEHVTYDHIKHIEDSGRIVWLYDHNEEGEYLSQPTFVYEDEDREYKQSYSEFYYTEKDGKYIDYIDEFETLEEMASEYFDIQTL